MTRFKPGVLLHKHELIAFLVPLIVYSLVLRENSVEAHFLNVATQYALWTTGGPGLGTVGHPLLHSIATDVDTVISNNHYYSAYAPGFSYLSIPFGIFGFLLNSGKLVYNSYAILTDEAFVALCAALASLVLYKVSRIFATPVPSLLASFALAFGTIVWPFATVLFEHDVAMLFSLLGVYCVLRFSRVEGIRDKSYRLIAAAGVSLAIASTLEYLSALLFIPLFLYVVYRKKPDAPFSLVFLLTFVTGPVLDLAYNRLVTGNFLVFPEDLLPAAQGQSALSRFDLSQLLTVPIYDLLSPNRGLFLVSPVLLLGIYGLYRMYRSGRFSAEAILFLSLFCLGLFSYSAWKDWLGGYSFGPRFLIDVIPYLVVPIAFVLSESGAKGTSKVKAVFLSLFVISSFIVGSAAFTSAEPIEPNGSNVIMFYQPIYQSIPWLLQNNLDVWWFRFQPTLGFAIVGLCFILIWALASRLVISKDWTS